MKKKALDNLLFLLLGHNAHIDDLQVCHAKQQWYIFLWNQINTKEDLVGWGGRFATSNIFKIQRLVFVVFGRLHIETMFEQAIQHIKAGLITYMTTLDDLMIYEVLAIASIKEQ
jgi:hypothetical protein